MPIQTNTKSTCLDMKIDVLSGQEAGNHWPAVFRLMHSKSPAHPAQNRHDPWSVRIQSTRWPRITLCSTFPVIELPIQMKYWLRNEDNCVKRRRNSYPLAAVLWLMQTTILRAFRSKTPDRHALTLCSAYPKMGLLIQTITKATGWRCLRRVRANRQRSVLEPPGPQTPSFPCNIRNCDQISTGLAIGEETKGSDWRLSHREARRRIMAFSIPWMQLLSSHCQ